MVVSATTVKRSAAIALICFHATKRTDSVRKAVTWDTPMRCATKVKPNKKRLPCFVNNIKILTNFTFIVAPGSSLVNVSFLF